MTAIAPAIDEMTLTVTQDIHVRAPLADLREERVGVVVVRRLKQAGDGFGGRVGHR